jgi:hypothetical protein
MATDAAAARAPLATAELLRRCLLALVLLSVGGVAVELAMIRHWKTPVQLVPWVMLAVAATAAVLLASRPSPKVIRTVRVLAVVIALTAIFGVYEHVEENYDAGPLDQRYETTWQTMPAVARWWAAISKTVGPAPPIAPAVLGQAALGLLFATIRHPALGGER